jgi:glutamyl-tRNA synthetase
MTQVRTRMAPSPTGEMHVGSMATLLKNYAFAKRNGGQFILRIEDTDKVREVEGGVKAIQEIVHRYGLDWDEGPGKGGEFGPYIQSERLEIYKKEVQTLIDNDKAYYCFCSKERLAEVKEQQMANKQAPHYDRHCRVIDASEAKKRVADGEEYVIRLKVPTDQEITFTDLLRGEITFHSNLIDDQVLLKSDGYPTYHLAVVIDDYLMKITHIMRGEEWISSTPKHVLLYQAFGWPVPVFAHIPVFLNPDGKGKMSKRKGMVSAASFLDRGYLSEAMLNFFMILGWARKNQEEVMTLEDYVKEFDPSDLSSNSVAFDIKKLDWLNGVYIRKLSPEQLKEKITPFISKNFPVEKIDQVLPLIQERLVTLADFDQLTKFFYGELNYETDLLLKKADSKELVIEELNEVIKLIETLSSWSLTDLEEGTRNLQEKKDWHRGQFFMMLRISTTGEKATPPLFETMMVLGKDLVITRLKEALNKLI